MPREGKRFARPGRAGSNLRRADARDELPAPAGPSKFQGAPVGSESASAASSSDYSNYDDDEEEDEKVPELEHEKKTGKRFANAAKRSSILMRHNAVDKLPLVQVDKESKEESDDDKVPELEHEKKHGKRLANPKKKMSYLTRANARDLGNISNIKVNYEDNDSVNSSEKSLEASVRDGRKRL